MPPLHKNKWFSTFLDLACTDLGKINWTQKDTDNLLSDERCAIRELTSAKKRIVKRSDKGGNVLLDEDKYVKEVNHLLNDEKTYKKQSNNPFPELIIFIN